MNIYAFSPVHAAVTPAKPGPFSESLYLCSLTFPEVCRLCSVSVHLRNLAEVVCTHLVVLPSHTCVLCLYPLGDAVHHWFLLTVFPSPLCILTLKGTCSNRVSGMNGLKALVPWTFPACVHFQALTMAAPWRSCSRWVSGLAVSRGHLVYQVSHGDFFKNMYLLLIFHYMRAYVEQLECIDVRVAVASFKKDRKIYVFFLFNPSKIEKNKKGQSIIYENGLLRSWVFWPHCSPGCVSSPQKNRQAHTSFESICNFYPQIMYVV